jgi:paraquat-inducible protein B
MAFENARSDPVHTPAKANSAFRLFNDRSQVCRGPLGEPQTYVLRFKNSVAGLAPGAPIELRRIQIGEVADDRARFDAKTAWFPIPVIIRVDPSRS